MASVRLHSRLRIGQELQQALSEGGYASSSETPEIEILSADCVDLEEVAAMVDHVLGGGGLLICGGEGPLLAALHLLALPGQVSGSAESADGALTVHITEARLVSGVGYALFRVDGDCVALAGMRGKGHVVFLGHPAPPPEMARAGLDWISRQNRAEER
ncbi:MAG: hypothetical protein ACYSX0_10945 [Planctomycetota bacterium]